MSVGSRPYSLPKKTRLLLAVLVTVAVSLTFTTQRASADWWVMFANCSPGQACWWSPGSYYSDNAFNNHNIIAVADQAEWYGGQYVETFGVLSGGSWCCAAISLGSVSNYWGPGSSYIKVYCWNRSNEPGYANISITGHCQRGNFY